MSKEINAEIQTELNVEAAEGEDKLQKTAVNYRNGQEEALCITCENFLEPNFCSKVVGLINPQATCDLFNPKILDDVQANADAFLKEL